MKKFYNIFILLLFSVFLNANDYIKQLEEFEFSDPIYLNKIYNDSEYLIIFSPKEILVYDKTYDYSYILIDTISNFNTYDYRDKKILLGEVIGENVLPIEMNLLEGSYRELNLDYKNIVIKKLKYVQNGLLLIDLYNLEAEKDQIIIKKIDENDYLLNFMKDNMTYYQTYFYDSNQILYKERLNNRMSTYLLNIETNEKLDSENFYEHYYISDNYFLLHHVPKNKYKTNKNGIISDDFDLGNVIILNLNNNLSDLIFIYDKSTQQLLIYNDIEQFLNKKIYKSINIKQKNTY